MPSSFTAGQVIDMARSRSVLFQSTDASDGQLLVALDSRQRTLLLQYGGAVDALVNTTVALATSNTGLLLGVSATGSPHYTTTYEDGWPVHVNGNGSPYVDFTEAPVAGDPFGQSGGVPGFPLPPDFLKLLNAVAVYSTQRIAPVDIVPERSRTELQRRMRLTAFISGNRLVPLRPLASGNSGDLWSADIQSIQLSYTAFPHVQSLSDLITLPTPLLDALVASLAEALAGLTSNIPATVAQALANAAVKAEATLDEWSVDVVGAASTTGVVFRR